MKRDRIRESQLLFACTHEAHLDMKGISVYNWSITSWLQPNDRAWMISLQQMESCESKKA